MSDDQISYTDHLLEQILEELSQIRCVLETTAEPEGTKENLDE